MTTAQTQALGSWSQRKLREVSGAALKAAEPEVLNALQDRLDTLLASADEQIRILDAGCGKRLPVPIADDRYVVGIDISTSQVQGNAAIDERIVGDVQSHPLEPESFDVVVCWNVLEHLNDPHSALLNLTRALKEPGILVLAVPHAWSVKGRVTQYTPFWVHRLVWSRFLNAKPSFEPFPTVMSSVILPERLTQFARQNELTIEFSASYEGWEQKALRSKVGLTGRAFGMVVRGAKAASFGLVVADVTDCIMVMAK